jgi:hypothetical protein
MKAVIVSSFIILVIFIFPFDATAQQPNPIITAFPSLRIANSSRGLAMGDCGIASAIDNQQLFYNAAKTAFMQNFHQLSVFYTPWLAAISNDTRFMNVNYSANTSNTSAFGISLSYLRLGEISTRDNNGALIAQFKSSEFNILTSYALQLTSNSSLGIGLRFLASQPGQSYDPVNFTSSQKSIFTTSADISYYRRFNISEGNKLEIGAAITNVGPKVNIQGSDQKTFLPTNLGIGVSYCTDNPNTNSQFTIELDANKLLVPTPPTFDANGNITAGKDPNRSVLNALFSSFSDAPDGFAEELREITINAGVEYAFDKQFFLRGGVSLESRFKGNRKFAGLGVGYKGTINDQSWGLDFHYLVPIANIAAVSPFQNCWGFALKLSIGNFE